MDLNKQIQKELDRFGEEFTRDLQKSLAGKERWYSNSRLYGAIGQSVTPATFKDGSFTLKIVLPSYYYWVDKGREPGNVKEEGQEKIADWANRRGIITKFQRETIVKGQRVQRKTKLSFEKAKKQFAFLAARKIKAKGYKAKGEGFFTEVYEDGRLKFLSDELSRITGKEIVIELTRNI